MLRGDSKNKQDDKLFPYLALHVHDGDSVRTIADNKVLRVLGQSMD